MGAVRPLGDRAAAGVRGIADLPSPRPGSVGAATTQGVVRHQRGVGGDWRRVGKPTPRSGRSGPGGRQMGVRTEVHLLQCVQ
jgi:hypothetical protein